jgi:ankyrin repeat protein
MDVCSLCSARTLILCLFFATAAVSPSWGEPVHDAARKGDLGKLKELVAANPAVVTSKDKMGKTPLHLAAANDHKDLAEFLLDHGADINARDGNGGFTPLDMALSTFHYKDVLDLLVARGADVNTTADNGITPLQEAAMRGQKDAVELLISKGADVNAREHQGNTPLLWALLMGHSDVAEVLIAANADVNARDAQGMMPLTLARKRGNGKLETLLRSRGAHE